MSDAARQLMSPEEFLDWCEHQEDKYELVDGYPVLKFDNGPNMMAGATERHDQIVINLIQALSTLRGGPCRVKTGDQAARMTRGNMRRPDVTVDCGPRRPTSHESNAPTVLFEVLSPSTRRIDLLRKTNEYQTLATVKHFVILEPDRPEVIVWSRGDENLWTSEVLKGVDAELLLPAVDVTLSMQAIYQDVDFNPA